MTEEQNNTAENKPKNMYIPICITQAICMAVILIAILIIKFFFEGSYAKLQKWYQKNILDETTVPPFFDEEEKA